MRKVVTGLLLLCLTFAISGCSVATIYLVRNFSNEPAELLLTIDSRQQKEINKLEIASADKIVNLKKSEINKLFVKKLTATRINDSTYQFLLPPGHSANITSLIRELNPGRLYSKDFVGGKIELKRGKSSLLFGNNLAEIHGIFKFQSFFPGGPRVYYLDLK